MKTCLKKAVAFLLTFLLAVSASGVIVLADNAKESETADSAAVTEENVLDEQSAAERLGLSEERFNELEADDPMYEKGMSQLTAADMEDDNGISTLSVRSTGEIAAYGIDVSTYQGVIDWAKVAKAGVSFAIIRIGYRGYGTGKLVQDDYAVRNIEGALANGIGVGCYFFSTCISEDEAREEAQFVIDVVKNYDITYPIAFDHEGYEDTRYRNYDIGSGSNDRRTAMSIAYNDYLEEHGYQGMQYGSSSRLSNNYRWNTTTLESKYQVWVANYRTWYTDSSGNGIQYPNYQTLISDGRTLPYDGAYRFWQFSSQGQIDGISGNVDLDLEYYTTGETESGKTGQPAAYTTTGDVVNMEYNGEDGWWYVVNDEVQTDYTGVANFSNEYGWWYVVNGKVDFSFTGLAQNDYGWWYVEDGQVIFAEDGFIEGTVNGEDGLYEVIGGQVQMGYTGVSNLAGEDGWWYVENGKVDVTFTGFAQNDTGWWYVENGLVITGEDSVVQGSVNGEEGLYEVIGGQVRLGHTGVSNVCNEDGWWYVKGGKVDVSKNSVEQNDFGWWYVKDGKVDFSYTGLAQNDYGWWYIENGQVIFTEDSVIEGTVNGEDGWYEVSGGQVQLGHTGVSNVCNDYGWWYVENGRVDFGKNGVEQNDFGWWYVLDGKVDFSYTGVANYANDYGWWYIKNGQVDFSKTSIEPNNYGWWRVVNGKVDFSCNSVKQNDYGWWYVIGGKVDFSYTGVANYANAYGWWYIREGKVDFSCNSVEQNNYGWWRVENGKVDFSYTGRASNRYGTWYCVNGKVDFSRS